MPDAIDIHGHVTSPELLRRLPMPPSLGDIDGMIEQKRRLGIATTIVGSPVGAGTMVPAPGVDNYAQPLDQLKAFHAWLAGTVRDHGDALRGYVYVNPYGSEAELEHAAELLREPEFVGLIANTSVQGRLLDQPEAEPFFALAAEADVPVLLHPPAQPVGVEAVRGGGLGLIEHLARPCDVTMGVAAIAWAGWLDRFPRLKLIASAAGAALPLLLEKLDLAARQGGPGTPPRQGPPPSEALRRIYVDTGTPSRRQLLASLDAFGPDRLLFGTDSPPLTTPLDAALANVDSLPLDAAQRQGVLRDNARTLFKLTTTGTSSLGREAA